jgi:hypothetical protein
MIRKLVSVALFFASGSALALAILPRDLIQLESQPTRERKGFQPSARSRPRAFLATPRTRPQTLRQWGPAQE